LVAPETQANRAQSVDVGAVYEAHRRLLVGTAISRYGIHEEDAETLLHDVFLAYILKADEVLNTRAWLVAAICNASKYFLQVENRAVGLSPDIIEEPDPSSIHVEQRLPRQLAARECFECLTPRCQLALRLRYLEGYSVPEIATELHTSAKYAQKLVSRCLQQAYDRYEAKGRL
jgi:RNA polymerase sigma factor (sigma-70 family)